MLGEHEGHEGHKGKALGVGWRKLDRDSLFVPFVTFVFTPVTRLWLRAEYAGVAGESF
ncbi:MAG TPA: hypothetical protein VNX88_04855 [Terriglobales bacterium]|jgi:hypothetical protein|nr:hypothetical protein [Terriglobales bacterium]